MKLFINIFILLSVTVLFTTCKKFPEDPFISLNTVKDRLKGVWEIENMKLSDQDYSIEDSLNIKFSEFTINFKFDRTSGHSTVNDLNFSKNCPLCENLGSLYFFIELSRFSGTKKSTMYFNKNGTSTFSTRIFSKPMVIRRIYNNKLILKNDDYEIHLKRISNK